MRVSKHEPCDPASPFAKKAASGVDHMARSNLWSMSVTGDPWHCIFQVCQEEEIRKEDVSSLHAQKAV